MAIEPDAAVDAGQVTDLLVDDLDAGFAELVRAHKNVVYTVLLRACGDRADAEDLAAEAFLRAYRALRGYDRERIEKLRLRPWLLTIALNGWRNLVRERSRRPQQVPLEHAPDRVADTDQFERVVGRTDDRRELVRLISGLPEQQRVAIVLRHVCELPVSEVAEVLAVPEGTLRSLVSRGLSKIRSQAASQAPSRRHVAASGPPEAGGGPAATSAEEGV